MNKFIHTGENFPSEKVSITMSIIIFDPDKKDYQLS